MPDMNLTDVKLTDMKYTDQISGHEIGGHEFGGQNIYRLKIDYSAMCIFLKQRQNTSHNSKVSCIICICCLLYTSDAADE